MSTRLFSKVGFICAILSLLVPAMLLGQASMNMTLLSNWDDNSLPTVNDNSYNDIWGYAANNREYAIMGTLEGTLIIDVTTPTNPLLIRSLPGGSNMSTWRDYKTYQNYLYAISDQGTGSSLQIFDLSNLPTSVNKVYDSQAHFSTAHNLFVNEASGRLYVSGANTQQNGILILDVATDPTNPGLLASYTLGAYTHDVFVRNDTCHAYFGNSGFAIFDLVNLAAPSQINVIYPMQYAENGYAHSGYSSEDGKFIFWADETHDTGIHIADMSDPSNLVFGSPFRSTLLAPTHTNSIPHNPFVKGNQLYVSYYHDGLQVWDISNPKAPVKSAYYDTDPGNTDYADTRGCWGVYPYLPSGIILTSDVRNGLHILQETNLFPITLANFDAEDKKDRVRLRWTTYSETNNEKFTVERSADGKTFEAIEDLPGAGNNVGELEYETYDFSPLEGVSYYRLQQTDFDGAFSYSEIVAVNRGVDLRLLSVYPSPAMPGQEIHVRVVLQDAQSVQVRVSDMLGRAIVQEQQNLSAGLQTVKLPNRQWAAGTYFVRVTGGTAQVEQKFVVTK